MKNPPNYSLAGVTDIRVGGKKSAQWALKYNMTPCYSCFTPAGPHRQGMTKEETAAHRYINGYDLPKKMDKELQTILAAGGNSLMVCNGDSMIEPGYFEVFRKYNANELEDAKEREKISSSPPRTGR